MTLRCECGGEVRCQSGPPADADPPITETYRCVVCNRTGTYTMHRAGTYTMHRSGRDSTTGCVTTVSEAVRGP